jgi:Ca2+-binding EF-hand superfamily protein
MTKLNRLLTVAGAMAILSAVAISVNAQEDLFTKLDVDQDGLISLSEAEAHDVLFQNFAMVDADSDGFVSKDELEASGVS